MQNAETVLDVIRMLITAEPCARKARQHGFLALLT